MLLDLFLIGLVVTVEPLPLTAMILLLAAERGLLKGLGFLLGWLLTLVGIVALTALVTGGEPLIPKSAPSTAALAVKLLAGVVLVYIAVRRRRRPARTEPKRDPRWMASVDRINPVGAAGLGFLLQPWVLVAAGVSTIMEAKLSSGLEWFAVFAFSLWCTASYFVLETYAALRPEIVQERLSALLTWINSHRDEAIVFLSMGLGLYLVAKSIFDLVSAG
jgi:threonine/homoserine/homoserine lactone efflux protein